MKSQTTLRRTFPGRGLLLVGTLGFAVSVQGGPRVTDGTTGRNSGRAKSDTARLVTGPSEHLNSVIAGGGTGVIEMVPVVNNGDGDPFAHDGAYDASNISGTTLAVEAGGFRMFWAVKVSNWDPDELGVPTVRSTAISLRAKTLCRRTLDAISLDRLCRAPVRLRLIALPDLAPPVHRPAATHSPTSATMVGSTK